MALERLRTSGGALRGPQFRPSVSPASSECPPDGPVPRGRQRVGGRVQAPLRPAPTNFRSSSRFLRGPEVFGRPLQGSDSQSGEQVVLWRGVGTCAVLRGTYRCGFPSL